MMFHLAIPCRNLDESVKFYRELGCSIGRVYHTHAVVNFQGHQLVLHLSNDWQRKAMMYPRHFGIIMKSKAELDGLWAIYKNRDYVFEKHFIRQAGREEEHYTFLLKDPSNNLIEFKWYRNEGAILG